MASPPTEIISKIISYLQKEEITYCITSAVVYPYLIRVNLFLDITSTLSTIGHSIGMKIVKYKDEEPSCWYEPNAHDLDVDAKFKLLVLSGEKTIKLAEKAHFQDHCWIKVDHFKDEIISLMRFIRNFNRNSLDGLDGQEGEKKIKSAIKEQFPHFVVQ